MIEFKGVHYPNAMILHAAFFYVCYAVSYCDLDEILTERHVTVDHATLKRRVVKFASLVALSAQTRKRATAISWRMDETYIKIRGKWLYLYRAVDKNRQTPAFILPEHRDTVAACRFVKRAIATNGVPDRVVIDKSGATLVGLQAVNVILKFTGAGRIVEIRQVKYLNNILEQDHRFIKRITEPMMGFKAFHAATATRLGAIIARMLPDILPVFLGKNGDSWLSCMVNRCICNKMLDIVASATNSGGQAATEEAAGFGGFV